MIYTLHRNKVSGIPTKGEERKRGREHVDNRCSERLLLHIEFFELRKRVLLLFLGSVVVQDVLILQFHSKGIEVVVQANLNLHELRGGAILPN